MPPKGNLVYTRYVVAVAFPHTRTTRSTCGALVQYLQHAKSPAQTERVRARPEASCHVFIVNSEERAAVTMLYIEVLLGCPYNHSIVVLRQTAISDVLLSFCGGDGR